jgi:hypothetical protein
MAAQESMPSFWRIAESLIAEEGRNKMTKSLHLRDESRFQSTLK